MVDESDGIEEAIEGQTRLLITAAAQAGERLARAREDALRRATTRSEREARELQSRFAAEQRSVRAHLEGVQRPEWWDRATPERIAQAYESAVAWRHEEPEAARAEQRITDELRERHGITPDQLRAQVQTERANQRSEPTFSVYEFRNESDSSRQINKTAALNTIERTSPDAKLSDDGRGRLDDVKGWVGTDAEVDRAIAAKFPQLMTEDQLAAVRQAQADQERADERRDRTEASEVMAEATLEEERAQGSHDDPAAAAEHEEHAQDARKEAGSKYDSAERRASTAADLEAQGHDHETVDRQMRADVSQGAPATDATKGSRAPRARKGRAHASPSRQRERGGLSR